MLLIANKFNEILMKKKGRVSYKLLIVRRMYASFLGGLFLASSLSARTMDQEIHSRSAILMEYETRRVLYEKNAHEKLSPASTTKVPAALYALKKKRNFLMNYVEADRDCIGTITVAHSVKTNYNYPPHWLITGGTHMDIGVGEKVRLEDLLYDMMLVSANDSANMVAKYVSGSVKKFTEEMNLYLKGIGCRNTHFSNPHGHYFPGHVTTAYDMALIACEALNDPLLLRMMGTLRYKRSATDRQPEKWITNYNHLIKPKSVYYYPYAIGGKTGYHSKAGSCLVAMARKEGKVLVVVLLGCPQRQRRYEDAVKLFEKGFLRLKESKNGVI